MTPPARAGGQLRSTGMKTSKQDKIEGAATQVTGKVKEKVGEAMNDPEMRDRGTVENAGGKVQSKVGDVKKVFGK